MKKVLLLISASFASFSLSFAQAPLEMLQKSDNSIASLREDGFEGFELPEGFTYANRKNVAEGKLDILGAGAPNIYIAAAIELPAQSGQVIKGVTYLALTEAKYGKIFIASRLASGKLGDYTLLQVSDTETKDRALTTVEFKTPVTTEEGKVYAVGYEVKSSGEPGSPTTFPVIVAVDTKSFPEGNLFAADDASSNIGKDGAPIKLDDLSSEGVGNLLLVVQGENLASTFGVASELLPSVYSQDGCILIDGAFDSFVVFDASGRLVANNSDTVLPSGTYIVKARTGSLDSVSKVVVK